MVAVIKSRMSEIAIVIEVENKETFPPASIFVVSHLWSCSSRVVICVHFVVTQV